MSYILTSESVNIGHPDKMCDVISDTILDMLLSRDKNAQVAVECAIKNRDVFLLGEVTTSANIMTIDYGNAVRETLKFIGYEDYQEFNIYNHISKQSPEINIAVTRDTDNLGAGDIGMMWGYACNETKEFMPLPIMVAHKLMLTYDDYRRHNSDIYKSDAKAQVSVKYEKNTPIGIPNIILCVSHAKGLNIDKIREDMRINVVEPTLAKFNYIKLNNKDLKIIVNPSGEFSVYGPISDAGLTGRKIAVDTYGSLAKVGGGAFSGKNPTKVDRSGAYYARYVAKNIVAAGLADKCEVQVSYAIGMPKPTSIYINCFGTNSLEMSQIYTWVNGLFDFSVSNIIKELDLLRPIYRNTACYGHFGRECFPFSRKYFPWETIK